MNHPKLGSHGITSFITHGPLSTFQISLKSEKLFAFCVRTDVRTQGRTLRLALVDSEETPVPNYTLCGGRYSIHYTTLHTSPLLTSGGVNPPAMFDNSTHSNCSLVIGYHSSDTENETSNKPQSINPINPINHYSCT